MVGWLEQWGYDLEPLAVQFRRWLRHDRLDDRTAGGRTRLVGLARSRDSRRRSKIAHHFLAADFGRRVIPAGVLHGSLRWISLRPLPVPDLLFSGRSPGKRSHEPSGDDDLRRGGASLLAIYSVSFPRAS